MSHAARRIFEDLIGRFERSDRSLARAISVAYPDLRIPEEERTLRDDLAKAEAAGAIELVRGRRGAGHLVERVRLIDPVALFAHSGIEPRDGRRLRELEAFDQSIGPLTDEGARAFVAVRDAILAGRSIASIRSSETTRLVELVRIVDALYGRAPGDRRDVRAFSIEATGDSKAVQRSWGRCCTLMRIVGLVAEDESDSNVADRLGLGRHVPLVHVAGPLAMPGIDVEAVPLLALPGAQARDLRPKRAIRTILTVENWESFRRHVAEAAHQDDIVVFSGGWPSHEVSAFLRALRASSEAPTFHWGDVDPSGIRIGNALWESIGAMPHLMTKQLATERGVLGRVSSVSLGLPATSPWSDLAAYLEETGSKTLEQEAIAPMAPLTGGDNDRDDAAGDWQPRLQSGN